MEWIKAATISLCAGIVVGGTLAAADLPSPAPQDYLGVVAGAFTLAGMFLGHYVIVHTETVSDALPV